MCKFVKKEPAVDAFMYYQSYADEDVSWMKLAIELEVPAEIRVLLACVYLGS